MNTAIRHVLLGILATLPGTVLAQRADAPAHHVADAAAKPAPLQAPAPCPTADEARRIAEAFARKPAPMPFAAAPGLKLAEVVVAGGMPSSLGAGIDGSHFTEVWDSLATWPESMVLFMKGGNVFEIATRIPRGEPSDKSRYFNLDEGTLSGHLRPDLITAIHGLQMPANEGFVRGVLFYDASGESVFGVFVNAEGREPSASEVARFDATWKLLKSLPQRCKAPKS